MDNVMNRFKRLAKIVAREQTMKLTEAHEYCARESGFRDYHELHNFLKGDRPNRARLEILKAQIEASLKPRLEIINGN